MQALLEAWLATPDCFGDALGVTTVLSVLTDTRLRD